MIAAQKGDFRMMNLLLDNGAKVAIEKLKYGRTALTLALEHSGEYAALILLNKAPDIEEVAKKGGEALFLAGVKGYTDVVKILLKHGADPNIKYGNALLPQVIEIGYLEIAKLLIEKGRSPNNNNRGQDTALIVATRYGYLDLTKLLLEKNADINKKGRKGNTALISAAQKRRLKITKLLLENKADVKMQNRNGETALIAAVQSGSAEIVKLLLENKADVKMQNRNGETALIAAAQRGSAEIVKLLLDNKADVNVPDHKGKTALIVAAQKRHFEVVKLLSQNKADVHKKDREGNSAFIAALQSGDKDTVKLLMNNADVNVRSRNGEPVLIIASKKGYFEIVELLLERKADVNTKPENSNSNLHRSALCAAVENSHYKIAELLIQHGADVNIVDRYGATPLIIVCSSGQRLKSDKLRIVKLLLEKGADVNFKQRDKRTQLTALIAALQNSLYETSKLLIRHGADVNLTIYEGFSPLMVESSKEKSRVNLKMVHLLLENGANVNQQIECGSNKGKGYTALIIASAKGHIEIVNLLLERKADVNAKSECCGNTVNFLFEETYALNVALKKQHYEIAELLIRHGADVNAVDHEGFTPLIIASKNKKSDANFRIVKLLLEKGAEINFKDKQLKTPLYYALSEKNVEVVKLLLQHKVNIGADDFIRSVQMEDNADIVKLLLEHGADPESRSEQDNSTALMNASFYGNEGAIKLLIEYGAADINAQDSHGRTALMMAASRDHLLAVKMLIDNGADSNITDNKGKSVFTQHNSQDIITFLKWLNNQGKDSFEGLMWAIRLHDGVLVENLLDKGVDVNEKWEENNSTPLGMASCLGYTAIIQLLIKNGADVNASIQIESDYKHRTPLMVSADRGDLEITKLLIKSGADVNALFPNGATALHFAVGNSHKEIAKLLVKNGANVNAKVTHGFFRGMTPLRYAYEKDDADMVNILLNADSASPAKLEKPAPDRKSKQRQAKHGLSAIVRDQETYMIKHSTYSTNLRDIGFDYKSEYYDFYMASADQNSYKAVAKSKAPGISGRGAGDDVWTITQDQMLMRESYAPKPAASKPAKNPKPVSSTAVPTADPTIIKLPNPDLRSIFRRLETAGFNPGPYHEKNHKQLSEAVKRFQKFAKLTESGVIDETTWAKIKRLYDPESSGTKKSE